jgi:pilus assembly protein CpaE
VNLATSNASESLRILLLSQQEGTYEELARLLASRGWQRGLSHVWDSSLALPRAREMAADIVLVDDPLADVDTSALIHQLSGQLPQVAIVVLIREDALQRAQEAVLAGARGFLTKPMRPDDVLTTLERVAARKQERPPAAPAIAGSLVVFCSPKGGTGRTTLALNTAVSLLMQTKQPTVLVDADFAAPALDVALNLDRQRTIDDLLGRLDSLDDELVNGVLASHASGLRVLLAPPRAVHHKDIQVHEADAILGQLERMFAWTVVDLGLPVSEAMFGFLEGADRVIVSVLPEIVGLRNTRLLLDDLSDRGLREERVWLVLSCATMRGGISEDDIEKRLRIPVRHRIPADQPLVTHCINRGVPLVLSHRYSAVARAINSLARQLADDLMPAPGKR